VHPPETVSKPPAPPSPAQLDRIGSVLAPLTRLTQPKVHGLDAVPDVGVLFVGNHTLYSFLDLPFMMNELWKRRGIAVRGLGDHGHYAIPVWRDLLQRAGMVHGTRKNVRALMRDGEPVLVFPGGAGEVFKKRGESYQLKWKERLGFAKLAIEFSYPIVPFAAVGAEDMLDVLADDRTPGVRQVSNLMKRLVGVPLPPLARGMGPTVLPRPERLYFWFGEPIDTGHFSQDDEGARELRDQVRSAVEDGIARLRSEQRDDPRRRLRGRLRLGADSTGDGPGCAADLVAQAFDAWNDAGAAGAAAWLAPNVRLDDPPDWPDSATWRGREAALARMEEITEVLAARWAEVISTRSLDEDRVVVSMRLRSGQGPKGRPIGQFHFLARIGRDQIRRIQVFLTEAEVLEAAGADAAT
jgi:1-acyl-sn-glycerol-3-phosphate acyltransferase/ketosteroid isomerase-like protein